MRHFLILIYLTTFVTFAQQQAASTSSKIFIDFVGSGDIQQSVSNGTDYNANTGLGIIFERYNSFGTDISAPNENLLQTLEIEAVFNIASTTDTIVASFDDETNIMTNGRNFGNYILNPISAKQSLYLNSNVYFGFPNNFFGNYISPVISGLNFRVIASNNTWQLNDEVYELGVMAFRGGIFHEFLPDNYRLNTDGRSRYSLFLGANFTYRGIFGDIVANEDVRKAFLGNSRTDFKAIEFNFGFRLNNLRVEFQMPIFKDKNNIQGLTGTQFLFTLKFIGGFGLKINPNQSTK